MKKINTFNKLLVMTASIFIFSQPVLAGKYKCWTNNEGVKECGTYVPPEYSQKRVETRGKSGRVEEVEERAKTKEELAEIERLAKLKEIEDAKIAEQKRKDSILLKTFTSERDINLLRDSKIKVIEGIITVTNGNNKALQKKLEKLQKKAANIERRGKKPSEHLLEEIKSIVRTIKKNADSITAKKAEQDKIRATFAKDMERFRYLKNMGKKNTATK